LKKIKAVIPSHTFTFFQNRIASVNLLLRT
jgi:hypothetical protein